MNTRQRIGDGEGDPIIGKGHCGAFVTFVERKSKYTVAHVVPQKTTTAVRTAVVQGRGPHNARVHTITSDNGRELSDHAGMAHDLDATISFAHPSATWERGVTENTNGLIRQFFPKSRDLTSVSEEELAIVIESLNHRPRKTLGFRTPHAVVFDTTTSFTVARTS